MAGNSSTEVRVSTVELFFDLVFVFTITQLTSLLVKDPTAIGLARVMLVFGNVWWMYGGYAWLTNAVPRRDLVLRLLMLAGMAGFLVAARAIPDAFGNSGVAFGVGYQLPAKCIIRCLRTHPLYDMLLSETLTVARREGIPSITVWRFWRNGKLPVPAVAG